MIDRVKLENCLGFKSIVQSLDKNLVVITGPSGAGKSIFIDSLLGLFALREFSGGMAEATIEESLELEEFGIESDEFTIFKVLRHEKTRYFVNNQQISKKKLKELSNRFLKYISHKDFSDFSDDALLHLLDSFISTSTTQFKTTISEYKELYNNYKVLKKELQTIEDEERKIDELKEFAKMQIEKIDSINPKPGEYEELMEFKKKLSKLSKIEDNLKEVSPIFELEEAVARFYTLIDEDSSLFISAMNDLRDKVERSVDFITESEQRDIDSLLDRIEKLSSLNKRFGSIEEALEFRDKKAKELEHYENISFEKTRLQNECSSSQKTLEKLASTISNTRKQYIQKLNSDLNALLKKLRLSNAILEIEDSRLEESGCDKVVFKLQGAGLDKISSGEFNRVRLALLALSAKYTQTKGILILDEIDANLSGEESLATAKLLKELSSTFQIVVISHQPHLPSLASMHLLVQKDGTKSTISTLKTNEERANEIARMISGENLTKEAILFAKDILTKAQDG
ncbi:MAG: AAA family ATPase [Campylobacterales bacterium]